VWRCFRNTVFVILAIIGDAGCRRSAPYLAPGRPIAGTLVDSEIAYFFTLHSNDYFSLELKKASTGIAVSLTRPDGNLLRNYPCSHDGTSRISDIGTVAGAYRLEIRSCLSSKKIPFELQLLTARPATTLDIDSVGAERLSTEADELEGRYQVTAEQAALEKYKQSLAKWRALANVDEESKALNDVSRMLTDLGKTADALSTVEDAFAIARRSNLRNREAEVLLTSATIMDHSGDTAGALDRAQKAFEIAASIGDEKIRQSAQYLIGRIQYDISDYPKATDALQQSVKIAQSRADLLGEAKANLYLAAVDFDQQRFEVALSKGEQTLQIFQIFGHKRGEAMALTYLGHFYSALGRKQQALSTYEGAKALLTDSGDFFVQESLFNGLGLVYVELGDPKGGLHFLEQALEADNALMDRIGVAWTTRWMGEAYFVVGDLPNAMKSFTEALAIFRSLSNEKMEATLLQDIGIVMNATGDRQRALDYLHRSLLVSQKTKDRRLEAWTVMGIGHVYETAGVLPEALKNYDQVLRIYETTHDVVGRLTTLYRISNCLLRLGRLADARKHTETALKLIEEFRESVPNEGLRTAYFSSMRDQYSLHIDILMRLYMQTAQKDLPLLAFEASERARGRALLDSLGETRTSITSIDPKQMERVSVLRTQLTAESDHYTDLLSNNSDEKALAAASKELELLTKEFDLLEGTIRQQNPHYAALVHPELMTLDQVQKELLDDDSVLLEYVLGDQASYLWAITKTDFASHVLGKRADIEAKVLLLRKLVTMRIADENDDSSRYQARIERADQEYARVASELGQMLLGPAASMLGRHQRLVIVAEGALQYLPFAALRMPGQSTTLIVDHEIVIVPSASILSVLRREMASRSKPDRTLAIFADPVFQKQDARVGGENASVSSSAVIDAVFRGDGPAFSASLPRLAATKHEAESILSMVPKESSFAALGFAATREAAMSADLNRYRIVHFATHTTLFDDHPELSSLVLSLVDAQGRPRNGFLRLRDIYNLKLSAELVVLSACDTAIGKEVKGEGLMSMVRGFMYSGTPRVLASLWKVNDDATADLMTEFYNQLLNQKRTPAAALRQAQIALMARKSKQAPYYWAGFQLEGEWK
jgi:CHAT domain-containing protein